MRKSLWIKPVLFAATCLLVAAQAKASTLVYTNGPVNGTNDAWSISSELPFYSNTGYISDTFTVGSSTNLTYAQVYLWVSGGFNGSSAGTPVASSWEIGTSPGSSNVASGVAASLYNQAILISTNEYGYTVWSADLAVSGSLSPGTYWLTLLNATTNMSGNLVGWDENDGSSEAWGLLDYAPVTVGYLTPADASECTTPGPTGYCSESFSVYGNATSSTPEPGTCGLMLIGIGLFGLAMPMRKRISRGHQQAS
jgi:PEP-CTERM motif